MAYRKKVLCYSKAVTMVVWGPRSPGSLKQDRCTCLLVSREATISVAKHNEVKLETYSVEANFTWTGRKSEYRKEYMDGSPIRSSADQLACSYFGVVINNLIESNRFALIWTMPATCGSAWPMRKNVSVLFHSRSFGPKICRPINVAEDQNS